MPLFDITQLYQPTDHQDMLVNTKKFGSALASAFSEQKSSELHSHNVVLMANHGFTTIGTSIKQAVYRAVYTHKNAGIQSNAIILRNGAMGADPNSADPSGADSRIDRPGITYLSAEQVNGSLKMNDASQERPWALWVREVEVCPLYRLPKEESVASKI